MAGGGATPLAKVIGDSDGKRVTFAGRSLSRTRSKWLRARAFSCLEEEGPREVGAYAHEVGPADRRGAEGGDGPVRQRVPLRLRKTWLPRCLARGEARQEARIGMDRGTPGQRAQHRQGLLELAVPNQLPRLGHASDGAAGPSWRPGLRTGCRMAASGRQRGRAHRQHIPPRPIQSAQEKPPVHRETRRGCEEWGQGDQRSPRPRVPAYQGLRAPNAPAMLTASESAWNVPPTPSG